MAEELADDPRVYLAAERTLLAWIRTGLAMMGFGFVVARFGLFLQELGAQPAHAAESAGPSLWIGTVLIGLGVAATAFAALRHVSLVRSLERGELQAAHRSALSVIVSFALAAAGVALAVYLIWGTAVRPAAATNAPPPSTVAATPLGSKSGAGHGKLRPMPDYSLFGDEHVRKYEESGGKIGHDWNGTSCLIVHTVGRKSGATRKIPLIYGRDGENYVLIASKGGAPDNPEWYNNLMAHPDVSIQVWDKVIPVRARTGSAADKKRVWPIMTKQWPGYDDYQASTTRDIPVVLLTPR